MAPDHQATESASLARLPSTRTQRVTLRVSSSDGRSARLVTMTSIPPAEPLTVLLCTDGSPLSLDAIRQGLALLFKAFVPLLLCPHFGKRLDQRDRTRRQ